MYLEIAIVVNLFILINIYLMYQCDEKDEKCVVNHFQYSVYVVYFGIMISMFLRAR